MLTGKKTFVSNSEDSRYPFLHLACLRKIDLELQSDDGGYWVHGIKDAVKTQILRDNQQREAELREARLLQQSPARMAGASNFASPSNVQTGAVALYERE